MRAIALIPFAFLLACTADTTSIELAVQMPDGIDELAIVVASQRTLAPAADTLTVFVPDDWAGVPIRLEVEGMASSTVVARGATDVQPVRGEAISALVQLVGADCTTVCTPGDTRCEGDGVATCVMAGSCPGWSQAQACASNVPYCSNGTCAATCSDECTAGATTCDGTGGVRSCANVDGDPCLDWTTTACDSGTHCEAATCVASCSANTCTITSEDASVTALAYDGSYIYWLETAGVMRRNETSGVIQTLSNVPLTVPKAIAVDTQHVYWLDNNAIRRMPKAGGASESVYLGNTDIASFALDNTHVYWSEFNEGTIQRRTKTLGVPTKLADTPRQPLRIVIDGDDLYFNDLTGGTYGGIRKMKKDGSTTPVEILTERVFSFAVDATHVYFMSADVGRIGKSGGVVTTISANADGSYLAMDATHVAWMDGNALQMRAKSGGTITEIGPGSNESPVILTPTHVAWSSVAETTLELAPRCACDP